MIENMTVVAITGGGRGIGRAIAERLAADGMRVAIGDIDVESAVDAASKIDGAYGARVDVADAESFANFLDEVESSVGPIDILVNNAGIMPIGPFMSHEVDLTQRTVDINLHGPLNGMRAVLPRMVGRQKGHIVNVASTAGKAGVPGGVVYCATKHAVVGMSDAVRQEFAADGISVTTVLPSFTNTELISGTKGLRGVPTVEPADVAAAVAKAIRRKRTTVYVPGFLKATVLISSILPTSIADRMAKLVGADRAFLDVDHGQRDSYDNRIKG